MNNNETIRNILTERRKELGISLSELARTLDIPKSTLSRYENLKHQYPLDEIQKFAEVLNLPPEFILGLNKEKNKPKKVVSIEETQSAITTLSRINETASKLDSDRQKKILSYAEYELQEQLKEKDNEKKP